VERDERHCYPGVEEEPRCEIEAILSEPSRTLDTHTEIEGAPSC